MVILVGEWEGEAVSVLEEIPDFERPTEHLTEEEVINGLADGTLISEMIITTEGLKEVAVYARVESATTPSGKQRGGK